MEYGSFSPGSLNRVGATAARFHEPGLNGSRYLEPTREDDLPPGDRRSINATITAMLNETLHLNLTDSFCGFKAHRVSAM